MKRFALFLASLLFCLSVSCEKETMLTIDQSSVSFSDAGGSNFVTLTANKPWSASSNQSWCKVSPSGGEEAAGSRVSISCDANTTYDVRTAAVTFTCAELTKTVSVSQSTNNGLLVSQTTYDLTKAAQQLEIQVQANVKFSVEVDAACKDWVKYNSTKGLTTSKVILDIAENNSYDGREGKVVIKQEGGSLSSTVTIRQSQLDGLFVTTPEYSLSNENHTLTVEITTNVEFEVKPEADWVKYVQTKGLSTKQIVLEVAENDTYDQRETKVNVKQKNGDLSGVITIKQDEKYGILVSQSEYNLSNEAQFIDVEVKYNVDFDVVIPDDCKDWIKQVTTKGLNTKNYTFSVAKNETYDNREGNITFKQKKGDLSGTVAIKQAQTDYLEVLKNEYTADINGEVINISVTSNVNYVISISEDASSWMSIVKTKGLKDDVVSISVSPYEGNADRMGEIRFNYGTISRTVKVYQHYIDPRSPIQFADPFVKTICVENWDTDGDGELSYEEAASVKSIGSEFVRSDHRNDFKSFDEFVFFTGIQKLKSNVFASCTSLQSITIPENINKIVPGAFSWCPFYKIDVSEKNKYYTSIDGILFNKDVTELVLFPSSKNVKQYAVPSSVTIIDEIAFLNCNNLESIILHDGIKKMDDAFSCCTSLKSITIPKGVTSIGEWTFSDCSSLSEVIFHDNIEFIGDYAFQKCTSLEQIHLPDKITRIGKYAFESCTSLTSIILPKDIIMIDDDSFAGCTSLSSISLPKGIQTIGGGAFSDCTSLESIVIPESVTQMGGAFGGCTSLKSVSLPEKLTGEIGGFNDCSSLESIIIPQGIQKISSAAFRGCTNLKGIIIPENVSSIGYWAFYGCHNLTSISLPDKITLIDSGLFEGCRSLLNLIIPKNVTEIKPWAFRGCSALEYLMVKAIIPPVIDDQGYTLNNPIFDLTCPFIYVPAESVDAYKEAKGWNYRAYKIQAIPES